MKKQFTLVELLIIIAIIALQAAILLPALSGARTDAKEASCLDNLKKIGAATAQYIQDNNGEQPRNIFKDYQWAKGNKESYLYLIAPYVYPEFRNIWKSDITEWDANVYLCPDNMEQAATKYFPASYAPPGASSSLFAGYHNSDENFRKDYGVSLSKVTNPDKVYMMMDSRGQADCIPAVCVYSPYITNTGWTSGSPYGTVVPTSHTFKVDTTGDGINDSCKENIQFNYAALIHEDGLNTVFADGHAAYQSESEWVKAEHWGPAVKK